MQNTSTNGLGDSEFSILFIIFTDSEEYLAFIYQIVGTVWLHKPHCQSPSTFLKPSLNLPAILITLYLALTNTAQMSMELYVGAHCLLQDLSLSIFCRKMGN